MNSLTNLNKGEIYKDALYLYRGFHKIYLEEIKNGTYLDLFKDNRGVSVVVKINENIDEKEVLKWLINLVPSLDNAFRVDFSILKEIGLTCVSHPTKKCLYHAEIYDSDNYDINRSIKTKILIFFI